MIPYSLKMSRNSRYFNGLFMRFLLTGIEESDNLVPHLPSEVFLQVPFRTGDL